MIFYFEKQIWVKQEKDKGSHGKRSSEMYKAVEKWHYRWMRIMTVAKGPGIRKRGIQEYVVNRNTFKKIYWQSIKKDLWQSGVKRVKR